MMISERMAAIVSGPLMRSVSQWSKIGAGRLSEKAVAGSSMSKPGLRLSRVGAFQIRGHSSLPSKISGALRGMSRSALRGHSERMRSCIFWMISISPEAIKGM